MTLFLRHYYKSILIALTIMWLSLSESGVVNPRGLLGIPNADKIGHFLAYALFSSVILLDSSWWLKERKFRYSLLVIPVGFGAMMELLQKYFTSGRQADWVDLAADLAGVFIGLLVALLVRKYLK
jgi:VanZ family protein